MLGLALSLESFNTCIWSYRTLPEQFLIHFYTLANLKLKKCKNPSPFPRHIHPPNRIVPSLYLKSGMPLGVLMPAPATTTMFWNDSVLIAVATSSRDFTFLSLFPPTVNIPLLHFQGKINKYENYYVICEIHVSCLICIYNENISCNLQ